MEEPAKHMGVDMTLGQLGTSDHEGWLTDLTSGEQRWCVLVDLILCVFASDDETERPLKTLLLPGLRVRRLLFMSAHPGNVDVDSTSGHRSPNGITMSGMLRHQFAISDPGNDKVDVFGSQLLMEVTKWIWKLEFAIAQQADITSQTNIDFRNDVCTLQSSVSDYIPSERTRMGNVDCCNNKLLVCRFNPFDRDGEQDEMVHRPLRHTESNPPKRQGRRLVRTPSCPTETSWCEPSNGGYFSKDEQTNCNSRGAYSLVEHTKGTHCSRDNVSKAERRPPKRSNALRRALSLSGITSTNIHANLSKNEKAHGNSGSQHSLAAHSNGTLLEETDSLLDDIPKPDRRSPKRMGGVRRALSLSGIISTKTHTNDGKTRRNSRSQLSSAARKNGTLLEETDCSLDDVPEADRCSPKRKNGLRRALSLSGVISTKTHTNSTLGKMKHFVLGLKLKRRRSVSHTTLGESPFDDYKQAWSLDMLPDDPNTTLLGSTTADCATQHFGSDFGRSGMKTAFSESALNCDGKRRPRQRRGCHRSASVTSHMYEHRTEGTPKTVTFLTQHESEATAKDATRPNTVAFTRECSDSNQGGLQDAASTSRTRQGKLRRRRSGLFRKAFFSSVFGFLRCTSGRHKGLGVTNCIGSRPTPWPETPSSTEEKTTCDVTNDHRSAESQKSGQRKKHRRWDHPPLIGNFRSRSKSLIRSENDDHAYVDDLPLIQGYLYWLQSSAEWQRRWCVLKGNVLYRLATPSSDDVIDNFKLDVWAVKRWDSGTLHRRPFCCELIYDEFCSEFFSTDSEGELLIWLNRLERVTGCPAETTSSGLARRKTVTGATQPLHSTARRVHSADSPFLQQQQQQLDRDRLWLQKQQLLEEVLTQKTALERQQRKTILGRSCQKRQDAPSECSSNYDVSADTDILWHLRMKKTATKLKINDLERHLEACQEKTKYDMFKQDRPATESSLIDEIDAVMTTDDLYRRLAELKLELAETDHDLKEFHYKALRNGQSMFLSQGNLNSHSLGCRCIYGKCDTGHEMQETRCRPERVAATSCINLTGVNTPHATIAARSPNEDGVEHNVQHNVQHNPRQRLTRKQPPFSGLTPRRAYSLRDSLVPQPTPSNSGPTISSSINRKPTFALAKAPVRRYDSDSAYIVTKNNRYPVNRSGPNGDVQRCRSPQQQQLLVTSTPFSKTECRPRIHGHAPLRRLAQTLGSCSIATYRDNLSVSPSGSHQENARNDPDEKKIVSTTLSKEQDYNSNESTNLTLHSKEQDYSTKDDRSHRRQDSDARNDTITTYDSGVGTMSDNQDNRVDGHGNKWQESTDAPQTSWLRRRSASITGHLGVLPSKLKAFMPSKAHANDGWASDDNKRLSNPLASRVGDVDIEALSSKYKLRRATEGHRADAEHRNNGDCRRHGVLVDDTLTRKSNIGDKDDVDVAVLRDDVRRNHRVVPPGESGGRDCTVHRCRAVSNIGYSRQRSSSGGDIVTMNNISDTPSIRSHNTVKCGPSADFASVARKDTPHRRVTRSDVSPWTTAVDTKSRGSVCHHCGTVVSCGAERTHERMQEGTQAPRCCTNGGDVTKAEISVEAMAHIAAFEKLIDDQLGLMSAARL